MLWINKPKIVCQKDKLISKISKENNTKKQMNKIESILGVQ